MKGFSAGDRIVHALYGTGTLAEVNESRTVIDFDEHGVHRFVTDIVTFERTAVPAPVRRFAKGGRKRAATANARG